MDPKLTEYWVWESGKSEMLPPSSVLHPLKMSCFRALPGEFRLGGYFHVGKLR